jgi:hypothetical protein
MTISGTSKWTTPTGYIAIDGDDLVQVYNNNIKNPFFRLLYIGTYSIQGTSTGGVEHRILDIPSQFLGKKWKIFGLPSYAASSGTDFGALYGVARYYSDTQIELAAYLNMGSTGDMWTIEVTYFIVA